MFILRYSYKYLNMHVQSLNEKKNVNEIISKKYIILIIVFSLMLLRVRIQGLKLWLHLMNKGVSSYCNFAFSILVKILFLLRNRESWWMMSQMLFILLIYCFWLTLQKVFTWLVFIYYLYPCTELQNMMPIMEK